MDEVVHAISDRYGFYHAGMFLIDDHREYAVLQAASSDGGRRMLNRNHRLRIGQVGIVGYVADTGEARIALDVGDDAVYFDNPDMPDTRSEMALPLTVGNEVIGVLDVQSNERNAFTEEDVSALQTMADQVAIALENARLMEESNRALQQLEDTTRQRIGSAWRQRAVLRPTAYRYTGVRVEPEESPGDTLANGFPDRIQIIEDAEGRQLIAPVRLRGQVLATIALRQDAEARPWNTEDVALVERLTAQIGIALENARMLDEIRARADKEQFVAEISAKVRESMDRGTILQTAVREIGVALGTDRAYVQLIEGTGDETYGRVDVSPVLAGHNETTNLAISRGETVSYVSPASAAALAAPLKVHNQVIGAIGLESDSGQQWLPQEIELVETVSTQVAQALENAHLFLEAQQAAQRMSALYTVGSTISQLGNLGGVFESLASVLVDQLGFTNAWIALVDRQGEALTGIADAGTGVASETSTRRIPLQQGARNPAVRAVLERTHMIINDVGTDDRAFDLAEPVRAALGRMIVTPIMVGDRAAGVVAVDRPLSTPALSVADADLLRSIADQAAVALQNADLLEETRRRASQLSAAAAVARDATRTLNVDQLMDQTVTLISEQFNYYHAGVFLIDNDSEFAVLRAGSSEGGRRMLEKGHKLRIGQVGIVGHVAHTGEPRIALDVGSDAVHFVNPDLPDTRSEMGLPLTVRDSVIGVLDVQSTEAGAFVEDDIAVLQTLADQLASAIANARLFEAVQHDATRRALINEVQRAAVTSLQPEKLLTNAATVISRRIRRASAMFLWNPGKRVLQNIIVCDAHGDEITFDHKINLTHASHPQILSKLIDSPRT